MKNEREKMEWVIKYLHDNESHIDILNQKFVDDYINKFKPSHEIMMYGANKCSELGKLLSKMYKSNQLSRNVTGVGNMSEGFPKWVYTYELP